MHAAYALVATFIARAAVKLFTATEGGMWN